MNFEGKDWKIMITREQLVIDTINKRKTLSIEDLSTVIIRRRFFSSDKFFGFGAARIFDKRTHYKVTLRGLSRFEQRQLERKINELLFEFDLDVALSWKDKLDKTIEVAVADLKLINESSRNLLTASKPSDLTERRLLAHKRKPNITAALEAVRIDHNALIDKTNKDIEIKIDAKHADIWNDRVNVIISKARENLKLISGNERKEIQASKPSSDIYGRLSSALRSDPLNIDAKRAIEILDIDIYQLIIDTNKYIQMTLDVNSVKNWKRELTVLTQKATNGLQWISQESLERIVSQKPSEELSKRLERYEKTKEVKDAISDLAIDVEQLILNTNQRILKQEKRDRRHFFDTIEKSPLTNEQAEAVISFDNRVQVIASAGSGKTSVMVARTAYAIDKGFIEPNKVLLLAYNKDAAVELEERINERLSIANIPSEGIKASTFHALGLKIIAHATGRKPRVAPWVQNKKEIEEILRIVRELRAEDENFNLEWDMFRLVWSRPVDNKNPQGGIRDGYDRENRKNRRTGFKTIDGKVVKSEGERLICDWLWFYGVRYLYEKPFHVDTATVEHSRYHPDFYYPEIDSWHEHWGIDQHGRASPEMERNGYLNTMEWKRQQHRNHSLNPLIETTFYDVVQKGDFSNLQHALESRGIVLSHDPQREAETNVALDDKDLANLIKTFMRHIKSNQLTKSDVETLSKDSRTHKFLKIFWPVLEAWNNNLREKNYVDFEDMLAEAVVGLEQGDYDPGFDLILVDEFQDTSRSRIRLVKALLRKKNQFLLTVGDDWQSINRFAGADIAAMTEFERWFGKNLQLKLSTTFRSPDLITKKASSFIMKNPVQIPKEVESVHEDGDIKLILVNDREEITDIIRNKVEEIVHELPSGSEQQYSAFILGRYNHDRELVPRKFSAEVEARLNIQFKTIHGSKGLEADFIIIPNLSSDKYGFPSEIRDDPILEIVMTTPDDFKHAEERRLMYVALTRARKEVTLIAPTTNMSPFVVEMLKDNSLETASLNAYEMPQLCPRCERAVMVRRVSVYGPFLGCSSFPNCISTINLPAE